MFAKFSSSQYTTVSLLSALVITFRHTYFSVLIFLLQSTSVPLTTTTQHFSLTSVVPLIYCLLWTHTSQYQHCFQWFSLTYKFSDSCLFSLWLAHPSDLSYTFFSLSNNARVVFSKQRCWYTYYNSETECPKFANSILVYARTSYARYEQMDKLRWGL